MRQSLSLRLRKSQAFLSVHTVTIISVWLLMVLIMCVWPISQTVALGIPHLDKLVHAFMYLVPALLLSSIGRFTLFWFSCLVIFGVIIEVIQAFLPYRGADIYDFCANALGVFIGWGLGVLIRQWLRKKR